MTFKERQELRALSQEAFDNPSRWRKLLEKGERKSVSVVKKARVSEVIPYTLETLKVYLKDLAKQKRELLEKMKASADSK